MNPHPLQSRQCPCGCGCFFQPKRSNQIYLNKQHSDFHYNNTTRKLKGNEVRKIQNQLERNEKILGNYFRRSAGRSVFYDMRELVSDGFRQDLHTRVDTRMEKTVFVLFKYCYSILKQNHTDLVEITEYTRSGKRIFRRMKDEVSCRKIVRRGFNRCKK